MGRTTWGWSGTVAELLTVTKAQWLEELGDHHLGLMGQGVSASQLNAWDEEFDVVTRSLRDVCRAEPEAIQWGAIFEFELPLENGRRPDLVLLAGGSIVVVELKQDHMARPDAIDQVLAYGRDLADYHAGSHGRPVHPVLLPTRARFPLKVDGLEVTDPGSLATCIVRSSSAGSIDLADWLDAPYAPLPTLIQAARMIFQQEPLPAVKRALSSGIPEAVDLLGRLAEKAARSGERALCFIAGVPGSGKTLAGLTLVHQRAPRDGSATFLSGNGPLVEVLQDALQSKAFVRDLHGFIRTYGRTTRVPNEHVIVFDEAQRAWDRRQVLEKQGIDKSEPDLLIMIGERLPEWAALVGLVGDGQEIHVGEEAGIGQWQDAITAPNAGASWRVHCPPRLASAFPGVDVSSHEVLDLTSSLRSRRADHLHAWIVALLAGELGRANRLAAEIQRELFPLYLTRDLDEAKAYAQTRYAEEPDRRYGLLASSRTQGLLPKHGVDSTWIATKQVKLARWYNAPTNDPSSCCALTAVVTEFGCQGLELDLPIVAWGDDLTWTGRGWRIKPSRSRAALRDPEQLRRNAYRVLLSRGRDGLVVFLPDDPLIDRTEDALLAAGMRPLPAAVELDPVRQRQPG